MSCNDTWDAQIADCLTDGVSPRAWRTLRAHMASCAACRRTYDRDVAALAMLEGRPDGAPGAIVDQLQSELIRRLDEKTSTPRFGARLLAFPGHRAAVGAVLALAAALILFVFVPENTTPSAVSPSALVARGGEVSVEGFRLFCIDARAADPAIRATAISGERPVQCQLTDRLHFTYSTDTTSARHLTLFAIGEEGGLVWYWPQPGVAFEIEAATLDAPLPGSFALAVDHGVGRYRVYGVFGDQPLTRAHVQHVVAEHRASAETAPSSLGLAGHLHTAILELQ